MWARLLTPSMANCHRTPLDAACLQPFPWLGRVPSDGQHFYVRQLRDVKIKPLIETFDTEMREDEFYLDPTRMTLVCGTAGFDGSQFKGLLASEYDIQL